MKCESIQLKYDDYAAGTLPFAEAARIQAHLRDCPHCARYYTFCREAGNRLRHLPGPGAPENFENRLRERLRGQPLVRPVRPVRWNRFLLAAACLACFISGALLTYRLAGPAVESPAGGTLATESAVIPLSPGGQEPDNRRIRFITKDQATGQDILLEMPASYRLNNLPEVESQYMQEISY